jgi:hypothetical protein
MFESADLIHRYTRAEAIRDSVLIDVSPVAREAGIRYPVALTRSPVGRLALRLAGRLPCRPPHFSSADSRHLTAGPGHAQGLLRGPLPGLRLAANRRDC